MVSKKLLAISLAVIAAGGMGIWVLLPKPHAKPIINPLDKVDSVPKPVEADKLYTTNPAVAQTKYKAFIAKYQAAPDPELQDQVGTARVKVGYLAAHHRDWSQARKAFLEADNKTKGTGGSGDFGTVNDQGAFEAIVCLEAAGKKDEAKAEYRAFIKKRPLSPLCMACYRRLVRMNGGKPTADLDRLIDIATKKQDADAKFESSVCGPRAIAYLCDTGAINAGAQLHDYRAIAKLCGTTETGTTIGGMVKGLQALGVSASAMKVNRQDLAKVHLPALVLIRDHYLTLLEVKDRSMTVYDTLARSKRSLPIPAFDDPDFFVNAILLNPAL